MTQNIINLEDVLKYGRFHKIVKGMSYDEVCKEYGIETQLPAELPDIEPRYIMADGIDIRFKDGKVTTINMTVGELFETSDIFDIDIWVFDLLESYTTSELMFLLMASDIAFTYQPDFDEQEIIITVCESNVKLIFYPATDDDSEMFDDYELYCIEI